MNGLLDIADLNIVAGHLLCSNLISGTKSLKYQYHTFICAYANRHTSLRILLIYSNTCL